MNINLIIKHLQKSLYFFTINKSLILSQIEGVLKALITPKVKFIFAVKSLWSNLEMNP